MPARQVNNAFGAGSPSWNLPFPNGDLTAAEIIAYCPHWLKSVDVIDRFVTNGGKSHVISVMINEFRYQPGGDTTFVPNSVCMMIQYAMRRAGFEDWTVGSHAEWARDSEWDETQLDVSDFRTPRITHPRGNGGGALNCQAAPIKFRDLAQHVKKHPSGADALDLTRCVLYAVEHPEERWLFPNHFAQLVKKLGGPQVATHSHLDRQIFARRSGELIFPPADASALSLPYARTNSCNTKLTMARTRPSGQVNNGASTPQKRALAVADDSVGSLDTGNKRRSGRLAGKVSANLHEDTESSILDKDDAASERSFAAKKRKLSDDDGSDAKADFLFQPSNVTSSSEPTTANTSDSLLTPAPVRPGARRSALKARQTIQKLAAPPMPAPVPAKRASPPIDPALTSAARAFPSRQPVFLKPPVLSSMRLVVDERSVLLYAEPGAPDLWASALSSTRFRGPRRHPPFRELYRLTDPDPRDASDWAENIRWAKEQHKVFGSKTWTEYDYHLECITEHRREHLWVSEEAICAGM
ncbi:hypothetical protein BU26DRAFT_66931 [Trematosphaeria pertusa]|uniref:Uncharacterized protein n=1 Tax=Trematosphaeria pertusa TaxID=390896 RepID=A0A6A6I5U7_9PLEO|nr:uncharacterized protein BU26DRAFT_66931 [Trematosphaeria pertusa]KAF2245322.1 hypothetical protein BU26DRAFT_66931 [Trematosphaeria pertusa]